MNEIINERIITAVKTLFLTIFSIEIVSGKPYVSREPTPSEWEVSSVISLTGSCSGVIVLRFRDNLCRLLLDLAKINVSSEKLECYISDMTGEMSNTIAGNVFSNSDLGEVMMSVPVKVQGKGHELYWSAEPNITVIPFFIGNEKFVVETELKFLKN